MVASKLRFAGVLMVALGVLGGAGAGMYFAAAGDKPGSLHPGAAAEPLAAEPAPPKGKLPETAPPAKKPDAPADTAAEALQKLFAVNLNPKEGEVTVAQVLEAIEKPNDLVIRVDVAAFRRVGAIGFGGDGDLAREFLERIYQSKLILPRRADRLTIAEVLGDAIAQIDMPTPCTYRVQGSQILIVPAYRPIAAPGLDPLAYVDNPTPPKDEAVFELPLTAFEQIYGGVVAVTADRKPLAEVLADLRKQTGANIVLDPRAEAQVAKATVSVALSDVRLYDALRVVSDMVELKMVYAGNVYYVTTPANAKAFQSSPPSARQLIPPPQGRM